VYSASVFRRVRAASWPVAAAFGALVLACSGCGSSTSPPKPLGQPARGPILSLVTAQKLEDGRPRGLTQYFAIKTRTIYATAFLGDLHGATQMVMTWSRLTAHGLHVMFTKEVPVTSYGIAYTTGVTPGTLPPGTYQVSASVAGVTRSVYWTVFTPRGMSTGEFAKSAAPLRLGSSGSLPPFLPKVPCVEAQSSASMPSTTDVRLLVSAYCPQDSRNGPTRGVVIATMNRKAGEWLVGSLKLRPTGVLTGSFNLDVCKLPGGSNKPGTALYYSSVIYYRGTSRSYSGKYVLPPAHLPPVVFISSSVPAGAQVFPGEKIVLHITASEPVSFGAELPIKSIQVSDPTGKIVERRPVRQVKPVHCGTQALRRKMTVTYTVPAGLHGPLTLTALAAGIPDQFGKATITFKPAQGT
jgi:hypothetical protein